MKAIEYIEKAFSNTLFLDKLERRFSISHENLRNLALAYARYVDDNSGIYKNEPFDFSLIKEFDSLEMPDSDKEELIKEIDDCIFVPRIKTKYKGFHRFNNRIDGRKLKGVDPFMMILPFVMKKRNDALVWSKLEVDVEEIEKYIDEKHKQGMSISYLHVFMAIFVRAIANRPKLNRYIIGNRFYARNSIQITMAVRRTLRETADETTMKLTFTGNESIFEIYEILEKAIEENTKVHEVNFVDKLVAKVMRLPNLIMAPLAGFIKLLDHVNLIPGALIKESPFHTTMFVTYLKSIKLQYIYHHIYNFGSTGLFFSIGKEEMRPAIKDNVVVPRKICTLGCVLDERLCDGLYFSNSLRLIKKYIENPWLLEEHQKIVVEDIE